MCYGRSAEIDVCYEGAADDEMFSPAAEDELDADGRVPDERVSDIDDDDLRRMEVMSLSPAPTSSKKSRNAESTEPCEEVESESDEPMCRSDAVE